MTGQRINSFTLSREEALRLDEKPFICTRALGEHDNACVCPYGLKGDYLWVKEPYTVYRNKKTSAKRVSYVDSKTLYSDDFIAEKRDAAKMPLKYCRKVLKILDTKLVARPELVWKLTFEVKERK